MNRRRRRVLLACTVALATCASVAQAKPKGRRDRQIQPNGPWMNGTDLGRPRALALVRLRDGVTLPDGRSLRDATLDGTELRAPHAPETWVGALLEGVTTDGKPVRLRIDAVAAAPDPNPGTPANENADLLLYTVSYQEGQRSGGRGAWQASSDWKPICPDGGAVLPLAGRWDYFQGERGDGRKLSSDPHELTFSCRNAAIAKCVERMGYRPWKKDAPAAGGAAVSHDELHQTCVRAIRADYCGNGDSLTRPGLEVNIFDAVGIQRDTADWKAEAAWTPDGARCVSDPRLERVPGDDKQGVKDYVLRYCPSVWSAAPCGVDAPRPRDRASAPRMWTEHQ
jgi:hypothetical protein